MWEMGAPANDIGIIRPIDMPRPRRATTSHLPHPHRQRGEGKQTIDRGLVHSNTCLHAQHRVYSSVWPTSQGQCPPLCFHSQH